MEESIKELLIKYKINACSVTVIKNYEVFFSKGFGKNINIETKFMAGSVSKPIFALGVMLLHDKKKINIDEDVNQYLKSWKITSYKNFKPKITLRQLLSHTAGTNNSGFRGYNRKDKIPTVQQILSGEFPTNSTEVIIDVIPGTIFKYSGGGITIAQLAICDKLKKDFSTLMDDLIFKKMNLNCSYKQPINKNTLLNYAKGYNNGGKIKGNYHIHPELAAAGLWTNSHDLSMIGLEMCLALKNKSNIFNKKIIEEMLSPQIYSDNKKNSGYGIGIGIMDNLFSHSGMNEGYITTFIFDKNGSGIVIMINNSTDNGRKCMKEIYNILNNEVGLVNTNKKKSIINLEKYTGKYYDDINNIKCVIKLKSGMLIMTLNNYDYSLYNSKKGYFVGSIFEFIVEFKNDKLYLYQKTERNVFKKK